MCSGRPCACNVAMSEAEVHLTCAHVRLLLPPHSSLHDMSATAGEKDLQDCFEVIRTCAPVLAVVRSGGAWTIFSQAVNGPHIADGDACYVSDACPRPGL